MPSQTVPKNASKQVKQRIISKNIDAAHSTPAGKKRSHKQNIAIGIAESKKKK